MRKYSEIEELIKGRISGASFKDTRHGKVLVIPDGPPIHFGGTGGSLEISTEEIEHLCEVLGLRGIDLGLDADPDDD